MLGARPEAFLRWAGGKGWLVRRAGEALRRLDFKAYHEPFLGGGAVFFSLSPFSEARLSDKNSALIEVYKAVRDDAEVVIEHLSGYLNSEKEYYRIRAKRYSSSALRAAQFIYLNQTSYNGLYRVNLRGEYNVPYGGHSKNIVDASTIRLASEALQGTILSAGDFSDGLRHIRAGDLVFLDPPYTVSHNLNGFIKYNQSLFCLEDQMRLAAYIESVRRIGAYYILTNAAHEVVSNIFECGDQRIELSRSSLIGGRLAKRGHVSEYIFTNICLDF